MTKGNRKYQSQPSIFGNLFLPGSPLHSYCLFVLKKKTTTLNFALVLLPLKEGKILRFISFNPTAHPWKDLYTYNRCLEEGHLGSYGIHCITFLPMLVCIKEYDKVL